MIKCKCANEYVLKHLFIELSHTEVTVLSLRKQKSLKLCYHIVHFGFNYSLSKPQRLLCLEFVSIRQPSSKVVVNLLQASHIHATFQMPMSKSHGGSDFMMTSSNRDRFRVTGPLWGEPTGHRWILLIKASDAEL